MSKRIMATRFPNRRGPVKGQPIAMPVRPLDDEAKIQAFFDAEWKQDLANRREWDDIAELEGTLPIRRLP